MEYRDDDSFDREDLEKEAIERERLEQERVEREMLERQRLEQERLERDRLERERLEKERFKQLKMESKVYPNYSLFMIPSWSDLLGYHTLGTYVNHPVSRIEADPVIFFSSYDYSIDTPKGTLHYLFGLGYYFLKFELESGKYVTDNRILTGLILSDLEMMYFGFFRTMFQYMKYTFVFIILFIGILTLTRLRGIFLQ